MRKDDSLKKWNSGDKVSFTHFCDGEPNTGPGVGEAYLAYQGRHYCWDLVAGAGTKHRFICEKQARLVPGEEIAIDPPEGFDAEAFIAVDPPLERQDIPLVPKGMPEMGPEVLPLYPKGQPSVEVLPVNPKGMPEVEPEVIPLVPKGMPEVGPEVIPPIPKGMPESGPEVFPLVPKGMPYKGPKVLPLKPKGIPEIGPRP